MSGWQRGVREGWRECDYLPSVFCRPAFKHDTTGPRWPQCSRHPDLNREYPGTPATSLLPFFPSCQDNTTCYHTTMSFSWRCTWHNISYNLILVQRVSKTLYWVASDSLTAQMQMKGRTVDGSCLSFAFLHWRKKKLKCWLNVDLFFHGFSLLLFTLS